MKYLIIILFLIACSEPFEFDSTELIQPETTRSFENDGDIIGCFIGPGTMPQYPGGFDSLQAFFKYQINWRNLVGCAEGKVFLMFVVEKVGSISNLCVVKGVSESYDKEALRVAGLMPNWRPGTQRSQPVRVKMVFPITFRL